MAYYEDSPVNDPYASIDDKRFYDRQANRGGGVSRELTFIGGWIGLSLMHGLEKKMTAGSANILGHAAHKVPILTTAGKYPGVMFGFPNKAARKTAYKAGGDKGALILAKKFGVFKKSGWKAAARTGLTSQFSKIALSRAAGLVFSGWNIAMFAPAIYSGVKGAMTGLERLGREASGLDFGGGYIDTKPAYTERQRALRAITSSRMSVRSAFGHEAAMLHR